jgi:hypothetical protein
MIQLSATGPILEHKLLMRNAPILTFKKAACLLFIVSNGRSVEAIQGK